MKRTTTPIYSEGGLTLAIDSAKLWLFANDRKWGFKKDATTFYCHRKRVEVFRKELGFHIPKVLLSYTIIFEVKMTEESYATWEYSPKNRQRMLATQPLIFVSAARLIWVKDAEHIARPR